MEYPWDNGQGQLSKELLQERGHIKDGGGGNHLPEVSVMTVHLLPHGLDKVILRKDYIDIKSDRNLLSGGRAGESVNALDFNIILDIFTRRDY